MIYREIVLKLVFLPPVLHFNELQQPLMSTRNIQSKSYSTPHLIKFQPNTRESLKTAQLSHEENKWDSY